MVNISNTENSQTAAELYELTHGDDDLTNNHPDWSDSDSNEEDFVQNESSDEEPDNLPPGIAPEDFLHIVLLEGNLEPDETADNSDQGENAPYQGALVFPPIFGVPALSETLNPFNGTDQVLFAEQLTIPVLSPTPTVMPPSIVDPTIDSIQPSFTPSPSHSFSTASFSPPPEFSPPEFSPSELMPAASSSSSEFFPPTFSKAFEIYSEPTKLGFLRPLNISDSSSQDLWDKWSPDWGYTKKLSDAMRRKLAKNRSYNPYDGLMMLTPNKMAKLRKRSLNSLLGHLMNASGRVVDMAGGVIFPINSNGLNRSQKHNTTLSATSTSNFSFLDMLNDLPSEIRRHICYAGGAVKNIILEFQKPSHDHDLFLVGDCNPNKVTDQLLDLWSKYITQGIRTIHALTVHLRIPEVSELIVVQIVLRHYCSPTEVVYGFDIDACACLYHENQFYLTPGCYSSLSNMMICVDVDRLSTTAVIRYLKYWKHYGFLLCIPMAWPEAYLDPLIFINVDRQSNSYDCIFYEPTYKEYNSLYYLFWSVLCMSNAYTYKRTTMQTGGDDYDGESVRLSNTDRFGLSAKIDEIISERTIPPHIHVFGTVGYKIINKDWRQTKELLFFYPAELNCVAEFLNIPVELEFVISNPGHQGQIGLISTPRGKMITGSFQPLVMSWKEWAQMPKFETEIRGREVGHNMFMMGCNPNLGRIMDIHSFKAGLGQNCQNIIKEILELTINHTSESFIKKFEDDFVGASIYSNLLIQLKEHTIADHFTLRAEIMKDFQISDKESIELGQKHYLNRRYGMGCAIDKNEYGITFLLDVPVKTWKSTKYQNFQAGLKVLFVVVPFIDHYVGPFMGSEDSEPESPSMAASSSSASSSASSSKK